MWMRIEHKKYLVATSGFLWFTTANLISVACRCDAQKGVKQAQPQGKETGGDSCQLK
jgi:hypothetical protein